LIFHTTRKKICAQVHYIIYFVGMGKGFHFTYQHWFTHSSWLDKLDQLLFLPACHCCKPITLSRKSYLVHYRNSLEVVLLKIFPSSFSRLCASLRWHGRIGPDSFLSFIIVLAAKIEYLWLMEKIYCILQHFYLENTICYLFAFFFSNNIKLEACHAHKRNFYKPWYC
jgi:hypothetical protein